MSVTNCNDHFSCFHLNFQQNITQWLHVFGVSSVVAISCYLIYQIFGTADIQPWNYPVPDAEVTSTDDSAVIANQPMLKTIGMAGRDDEEDDDDEESSSGHFK